MHSTVLFFLIVLLGVEFSHGCSCPPPHPQKSFCQNDLVVKVEVISFESSHAQWTKSYKVKILQVYKWRPNMLLSEFVTVETIERTTLCGVHLAIGEIWLLSGHWMSGKLMVHQCEWNVLFSSVTDMQLQGLMGMYAGSMNHNCKHCKMLHCDGDSCAALKDNPFVCPWKNFGCKNDACQYHNGVCSWRNDCAD